MLFVVVVMLKPFFIYFRWSFCWSCRIYYYYYCSLLYMYSFSLPERVLKIPMAMLLLLLFSSDLLNMKEIQFKIHNFFLLVFYSFIYYYCIFVFVRYCLFVLEEVKKKLVMRCCCFFQKKIYVVIRFIFLTLGI